MTSRRSYLGLLAGSLTMLSGCGYVLESEESKDTPSRSTPTRSGTSRTPPAVVPTSSFEHVVDMVADAGVDPDGEQPIDDALDAALGDDTLLSFPPGTYRLSRSHTISDVNRVGLVGHGDAQFRPPSPWNGKLIETDGVDSFLCSGFDIDMRDQNTVVGLRIDCDSAFRLENVEFVGRGTHTDPDVIHAVNAGTTSERGRGVIRNVTARHGSSINRYKQGDGRGGIYIGPWNRGTISIEDCHLAEFGNNAVYASRTPGDVRVLGGIYRNNNPSSVRISGRGSRVEDATIEVDPAQYDGTSIDASVAKLRGVVVEQKTKAPDLLKPHGATLRNCRVDFARNPTKGPPVVVWSNGKTLDIESCGITVQNDTPAVLREGLTRQGSNPPWSGQRWVRIVDTTITGSGVADTPAVRLIDAPGSVVRNCRIRRPESGCEGVDLIRSAPAQLVSGSIRTGSYPLVVRQWDTEADCVVRLDGDPTLEMLDQPSASDVEQTSSTCHSARNGSQDSDREPQMNCCVVPTAVDGHDGEAPGPDIGITGLRDRSVSYQLFGDSN